MKREQKYLVLSIKDVTECLDEGQKMVLEGLLSKVEDHRRSKGKEPINAVVLDKHVVGNIRFEKGYALLEKAMLEKQQRECHHEWENIPSGMQFEELRCKKCGAYEII